MEDLRKRNAARLAALIDANGWPGRSRVGEDGARAAWLILQHAIGNPPLMRRGWTLLRGGANEGEVSPLEDPAGVDARRREIGLGPLDQDLRRRRAATARGGAGATRGAPAGRMGRAAA